MPRRYNAEIFNEETTVKASVSNAKVSFKNTRETCTTLRGRTVGGCLTYLQNVIDKRECVPMRRYSTGCGHTAQARKFMNGKFPARKGRWPKKSAELLIKLLKNIKNNASLKSLNGDELVITMVSVNRAPKIHGSIHRAYGSVTPFNKSPCHVQMVCSKQATKVSPNGEIVE